MQKNLLVFPCGSEIALEIYRSLRYSTHFNLKGASSVDDHGRFVFDDYTGGVPFHTDDNFGSVLKELVVKKEIDAVFPAMDAVARTLKRHEHNLGCRVIGSTRETIELCASKVATYQKLSPHVPCPVWATSLEDVNFYPIFVKPDEGYGSRYVKLAHDLNEAQAFVSTSSRRYVFCEYLPGREYTIDCFTDKDGRLLFAGARERNRIVNGISVNTTATTRHANYFIEVAEAINGCLQMRGAWFFQMKENHNEKPFLLEIGARLGGSSSYFRAKGVNFAMLSAFDAFDVPVSVQVNQYSTELDRALENKFKLDIDYDVVYVDFDDCLIIDNKVNKDLIAFIYQALNEEKAVKLVTRHSTDVNTSLEKYRLSSLFEEVIHITDGTPKSDHIKPDAKSIFIDDSFAERRAVFNAHGCPTFAPDMVEALTH